MKETEIEGEKREKFKDLITSEEEVTGDKSSEDFEEIKVFFTPETRYWWKFEFEGHKVEDLLLLEPEVCQIEETMLFNRIFKVPKWEVVDSGLAEVIENLAVSTSQEQETQAKKNLVKRDPTGDIHRLLLARSLGKLKNVPEDENDWVNNIDFDFIEIAFTRDKETKKIKALVGREESIDEVELGLRRVGYRGHHIWLMVQLGVAEEIIEKYEDLANKMDEDDVPHEDAQDSSEEDEELCEEEKNV